jgi:hypothetical protein
VSSGTTVQNRATLAGNNVAGGCKHLSGMMSNDSAKKVSLIDHYVQSLCGLYSRIARQLNVDRSYVSRVARGQRRSEPIEQALTTEFDRIVAKDEA